ncbi:nucleotidyltransferase family protein [Terasakiella sp. SH-1]|uniref:nucleotidyltransferase family protein n=1 Tax=Terasakiella sp. SH-1 TaxID=2560057 RepID=UPI001073E32C|nr:nucleotidyltransferase family protein [Terasakiella sp. SH-1]
MSDVITSGMVLAAGLGTRMRPLTLTTPKPLIPVAGRTMADRALDRLKEAGVTQAVLNISYLGEQIEAHFATRTDLDIQLSKEDEPLETGGGVHKALPMLSGDAFFVMNGDAVLVNGEQPTLQRLADQWGADLDVLLLLLPIEKATGYEGYGDFTLNEEKVPAFRGEAPSAPYVFSGTQILSRRVFDGRKTGKWSLREVYQDAIVQGRAQAIVHDGDWLHVGTPEGLEVAERYFAECD